MVISFRVNTAILVWIVTDPPPIRKIRPVTLLRRILTLRYDCDIWLKVEKVMLLLSECLITVPCSQFHICIFVGQRI